MKPRAKHRHTGRCPWQWCDRCDGCGWYEGGKTLQTTCHECGGAGRLYECAAGKRATAALRSAAATTKEGGAS